MTLEIIREILPIGKQVNIAYTMRKNSSPTSSSIVFIHGFGSSKEFYRYAFEDPSLQDYTLIALDLIGFGLSSKPETFSYEMSNQASFIFQVLAELGYVSFHLCTHSMGGLIGMEMFRQSPSQIRSLINLEGNLTLDDCFATGLIIEHSIDEFLDFGRNKFEESMGNFPQYLQTLKQASSVALYRSAEQTVKDSSNPELITDFITIPTKKCYIYGDRNRGKFSAEKILAEANVPLFYIENSGHEMAEQNPTQLYSVIREFIES
jgi:pimeloyl-ACP methyl ester carboxylesterase